MTIFTRAARAVKSAQGRLAAGVALVAITVWLCEPTITGRWNWEAVAAFSVALVAWLFSCLPEEVERFIPDKALAPLNGHDRQLFEKFCQLVPDSTRQLLREHEFGGTFDTRQLNGMREIADGWHGAEFEFDDPAVQADFAELLGMLRGWSGYVALYTYVLDSNPFFASVLTDLDRQKGVSAATRERTRKINEGASALVKRIDQFVRLVRPRSQTPP